MALLLDCVFSGSGLLENYSIPGYSAKYEWRTMYSPSGSSPASLSLSSTGTRAIDGAVTVGYILWDKTLNAPAVFDAPVGVDLFIANDAGVPGGGKALITTGSPTYGLYTANTWELGSSPRGVGATNYTPGQINVRVGEGYSGPLNSQVNLPGNFGSFATGFPAKITASTLAGLVAYRLNDAPLGSLSNYPMTNPTGIGFVAGGGLSVTRIRVYDNDDATPVTPVDPDPEPLDPESWWTQRINAFPRA